MIVTMFAPAIKLNGIDNCLVAMLYVNGVFAPFNVAVICDDAVTFNTLAVIEVVETAVLNGFVVGDVMVTIGAGVATGCE